MGDPIKLQNIVDGHIKRVLALRDGVFVAHAGLLSLGEMEWKQYLLALPPAPRATQRPTSFAETTPVAKDWILASALRELSAHQALFLEQIRQFMEIAHVLSSDQSEEKKKKEILDRVQDIPPNIKELIEQLEKLLSPHFHCAQQIRTLLALNLLFSSRSSGTGPSFSVEPLTVHLDMPRFSKSEPGAMKLDYEIERTELKFQSPNAVEVTPELIYGIFFTAFSISKNIAEACQFKFSQNQTQPLSPASMQSEHSP
jgi:hypothetical protein